MYLRTYYYVDSKSDSFICFGMQIVNNQMFI